MRHCKEMVFTSFVYALSELVNNVSAGVGYAYTVISTEIYIQ